MIPIKEIYEDVALDNINTYENGDLSYAMFNRLSRRAELRMLSYLAGDIENLKPPMPYTAQLLKDILAPLIETTTAQVINGAITRPTNYYAFDSMVLLGNYSAEKECDEDKDNEDESIVEGCNTVIQNLDSSVFDGRCKTYIEGLEPSFDKPIAKMVGRQFEFMPFDMGSVKLQYIRYPIFGKIVVAKDTVYNQEIVDEALSTNYEYDQFAREMLVFWITQEFSVHTREQALMQANLVEGKSARG